MTGLCARCQTVLTADRTGNTDLLIRELWRQIDRLTAQLEQRNITNTTRRTLP